MAPIASTIVPRASRERLLLYLKSAPSRTPKHSTWRAAGLKCNARLCKNLSEGGTHRLSRETLSLPLSRGRDAKSSKRRFYVKLQGLPEPA